MGVALVKIEISHEQGLSLLTTVYRCVGDCNRCTKEEGYDSFCYVKEDRKFTDFDKKFTECPNCGGVIDEMFVFILFKFQEYLPEKTQVKCCACYDENRDS